MKVLYGGKEQTKTLLGYNCPEVAKSVCDSNTAVVTS